MQNYCRLIISNKDQYSVTKSQNNSTKFPGKWNLKYVIFDITFTRKDISKYLAKKGFIGDNQCYDIPIKKMIKYLNKYNVKQIAKKESKTETEFITIYGIGTIPIQTSMRRE